MIEEHRKKADHGETVSGTFPLNLEAALQHGARVAVMVINQAGLSLEIGMGVKDGVIIVILYDPDQHLVVEGETHAG